MRFMAEQPQNRRQVSQTPPTESVVRWTILIVAWTWGVVVSAAPHSHQNSVVLAPGYTPLEFVPPPPGSYLLPVMGMAADGDVLDNKGKNTTLHTFIGKKPTVLSFIFTTCNDVNGCPLATHVMRGIQETMQADPETADRVRLVSLSFDPEFDTPEVIDTYGAQFRAEGFDWQFLTTKGAKALDPILNSYGQWVIRDYDSEGKYLGSMSHILRVFLIDKDRHIRNIYSTSFLHADTVANDVRSLLLE